MVETRRRPPARRSRPVTSGGWLRRVLQPVVAVLLLGWAATCLIGVGRLGAMGTVVVVLATFTPYICVAAVPLVTLALRRRRWVVAGLILAAALLPWTLVLGYASSSDRPATQDTAGIRVMIVDAHHGQADAGDVVSAVSGNSVDLLVVTELSGMLAHDLTTNGLDRVVTARWLRVPGLDQAGVPDAVDAGIGVWSRLPLTGEQEVPGTQWPALNARVVADEAAFTLVTGHAAPPIPDGGARWAADLEALRVPAQSAQKAGPVLLLGNLNATPWHADFRRLTGSGLVDAADALGQGLRSTWPTWSPIPLLPLDHALVGGGITVDDVDTVRIGGTDHRALLVTLQIPRTKPSAGGG